MACADEFGERAVEPRELVRRQSPADMAGIVAVEHDELPARRFIRAANLERRAVELAAHRFGFVVISGNAQHRLLQAAEDAAKTQITGRVVLHQIAGHQARPNNPERAQTHRRARARRLESVSTPRSLPAALPYRCGSVICRICILEIVAKQPERATVNWVMAARSYALYINRLHLCERVPSPIRDLRPGLPLEGDLPTGHCC